MSSRQPSLAAPAACTLQRRRPLELSQGACRALRCHCPAIHSSRCRNAGRPIRSTCDFREDQSCAVDPSFFAAALVLAPLGAQAADLVVWWEKGSYAQEDEAVREIIEAFEQESGKQVELVFHEQDELPTKIAAALEAGRPPDFAFGLMVARTMSALGLRRSAGRSLGRCRPLFGSLRSGCARLGDLAQRADRAERPVWAADRPLRSTTSTFGRACWSRRASPLPTFQTNGSVLGVLVRPSAAGRASDDEARGHLGHRAADVGRAGDTVLQFFQFVAAYDADYVTRDGRLVIDDPEIRQKLIKAHRQLHRHLPQGLHPARFGDLGRYRQQQGVPGPSGGHDAERHALDPQRAQARASGRLLQEHRDDRMAAWPAWRALSDRGQRRFRRGLQGRRQRRHGQGVRPLPRGRGLADALSRLLRRAPAAADVEAARAAVLARSERSRTAWPR